MKSTIKVATIAFLVITTFGQSAGAFSWAEVVCEDEPEATWCFEGVDNGWGETYEE